MRAISPNITTSLARERKQHTGGCHSVISSRCSPSLLSIQQRCFCGPEPGLAVLNSLRTGNRLGNTYGNQQGREKAAWQCGNCRRWLWVAFQTWSKRELSGRQRRTRRSRPASSVKFALSGHAKRLPVILFAHEISIIQPSLHS